MFCRSIIKSITFCLLLFSVNLFAQPSLSPFDLHPPLQGDLYLSGSFGEVRTNSFHAGIDFRTGGKVGKKVFASDNGFVSRIKVSGFGFGKAVYIQHPNGLTTVYAHLDRFASHIEEYVKERQYQNKSFEVDIQLGPNTIKINRGEFIGLSGNSGSSGGPHLHYEVRLTKDQIPLNPAFSNLKIIDTIKPVINSVWLYSLDASNNFNILNTSQLQNVQKTEAGYVLRDTMTINGDIGIGLKTFDYVNKNSLRCGVYEIKMFVNGNLQYHFSQDDFSFGETRFANSHIDYAMRQETGKRINKLFKEPNNRFRGYKSLVNNGIISHKLDSIYDISIEVSDAYSNRELLQMVIKAKNNRAEIIVPDNTMDSKQNLWLFFEDNQFDNEDFKVSAPKNILYNNIYFSYSLSNPLPGMYSPIIHVHNKNTPIHRHYELSISTDSLPFDLQEKAIIATYNQKNEVESVGGSFNDNGVTTYVNFFGDFFVVVDTVPPTINPVGQKNNSLVNQNNIIAFKVKDNLSGIAHIEGLIDEQWALFEYDPKNDLVEYRIDKTRLSISNEHSLTLKVIDNKGNKSLFIGKFSL